MTTYQMHKRGLVAVLLVVLVGISFDSFVKASHAKTEIEPDTCSQKQPPLLNQEKLLTVVNGLPFFRTSFHVYRNGVQISSPAEDPNKATDVRNLLSQELVSKANASSTKDCDRVSKDKKTGLSIIARDFCDLAVLMHEKPDDRSSACVAYVRCDKRFFKMTYADYTQMDRLSEKARGQCVYAEDLIKVQSEAFKVMDRKYKANPYNRPVPKNLKKAKAGKV